MLWWRPDGDLVRDAGPVRRFLPILSPGRIESTVFFHEEIDAGPLQAFLAARRAESGKHLTILHLITWAVARVLAERPQLNRFTAGGRLYQRRGIHITMSVKKARTDRHGIASLKREIDPHWSVEQVADTLQQAISLERADRPSATEREVRWLLRLPVFALRIGMALVRQLDAFGLLPGWFIRQDPMFASAFVVNLGSLGLGACAHHLFEYGSIPLFIAIGALKKACVPGPDDRPVVREVLPLGISYDERVADGFYCLGSLRRLREILLDPAAAAAEPVVPGSREITRVA